MKKIFFLLFLCFLFIRCGYHLRGTGSFLPPHIKKINIPMFKNMTTRFELDLKLTQAVIDELIARGKIEITGDIESADAIMLGEISSFNVIPIAFSGEATADRYQINVVTSIILKDLINQKVIFSHSSFAYLEKYDVPEGTDFESVESQALDKIAEKYASSLVVTILEGF